MLDARRDPEFRAKLTRFHETRRAYGSRETGPNPVADGFMALSLWNEFEAAKLAVVEAILMDREEVEWTRDSPGEGRDDLNSYTAYSDGRLVWSLYEQLDYRYLQVVA